MVLILVVSRIMVSIVFASKIVHYQFGINFGQVFFDYSESGNHGQNGVSINSMISDTFPFDRGAYFREANNVIKLPPNDINPVPIQLNSTFSIVTWYYPFETTHDPHIFVRINVSEVHFTIYRSPGLTSLVSKIVKWNDTKNGYLSNSSLSSKNYAGKWMCVSMILKDKVANFYANNLLFSTINLENTYSEAGLLFNHYIGYTSSSLTGFVWSFYLFNEEIQVSDFLSDSYSGSNCLGSVCPSSCSPAIKENNTNYCISESDNTECLGCSFGCKQGVCLDCSSFSTKSCKISNSGEIQYICPHATPSIPCVCENGYFLTENYYTCKKCYQECLNCTLEKKCSNCVALNAKPDLNIGCYCDNGFYNTSLLVSANTCITCHIECEKCSKANICQTCKSFNAIPHQMIGCVCNSGYYNSTSLADPDSCKKCDQECNSCITSGSCVSCKDPNAFLNANSNCECNKGYYTLLPLETGGTCIPCHPNCKECIKADSCTSCKDENSKDSGLGCVCNSGFYNISTLSQDGSCISCFNVCECLNSNTGINISGECICKKGFYNETRVTSETMCKSCNPECETCQDPSKCLTCLDLNSKPSHQSGCDCLESFYKDSKKVCQPCHQDCKNCSNLTSCDHCWDINAFVNVSYCSCLPGYFNSSLTSRLSCSKCSLNCSECISKSFCLKCSYSQMARKNGICECPVHSTRNETSCEADPGYFITNDSISDFISLPCDETCETCTDAGEMNCLSCAKGLTFLNGQCKGCQQGQYFDSEFEGCLNCSKECASCLNFSFCLKCTQPLYFLDKGKCKPCPDFQYLDKGQCKNCSSLCIDCEPRCAECEPECLECVKNASLDYNRECKCFKGFTSFNQTCTQKLFTASLFIKNIRLLEIVFSEEVKQLKIESFHFSVKNRDDFKVTLLKHGKLKYSFGMTFENKVEEGTPILVEISIKSLTSLNGSLLKENILTGKLPSYTPKAVNPIVQTVLNYIEIIVQVTVSSSVAASLVSNPSAAWALLNSIQLLMFLPLSSNQMTSNIKTFLQGFSGYNILPNILGSWFDEQASAEPFLEAKRYGIESSVFLVNTGKTFSIFAAAIVSLPFIFAVFKLTKGKISLKALNFLEDFKFGFFLRFWIQSFLENIIFAVVQLRSSVVMPVEGYFNQFLASIISFAAVLTIPLIFIFFRVTIEKIKNPSEVFKKKWGSLFLEFKNEKGFWSTQYYFMFFSRRLAYVLSQVYLNSWLFVQGGLNISFSLVILAFLIYYRPFAEKSILLSNINAEVSISLTMILTFSYLWEMSNYLKETLEMVIIFVVLTSMMIQFLVSMYCFYVSMKIFWLTLEKTRSLQFVRSFNTSNIPTIVAKK